MIAGLTAVRCRTCAAALVLAACAAGCSVGGDDDLVTLDRVGRADAPKVLSLQVNADYSPQSPTASQRAEFKRRSPAGPGATRTGGWT